MAHTAQSLVDQSVCAVVVAADVAAIAAVAVAVDSVAVAGSTAAQAAVVEVVPRKEAFRIAEDYCPFAIVVSRLEEGERRSQLPLR